MPQAPRWNNKAKKIVYRIIGVPENMDDSEKKRGKKIKKRLLFEDGEWSR